MKQRSSFTAKNKFFLKGLAFLCQGKTFLGKSFGQRPIFLLADNACDMLYSRSCTCVLENATCEIFHWLRENTRTLGPFHTRSFVFLKADECWWWLMALDGPDGPRRKGSGWTHPPFCPRSLSNGPACVFYSTVFLIFYYFVFLIFYCIVFLISYCNVFFILHRIIFRILYCVVYFK